MDLLLGLFAELTDAGDTVVCEGLAGLVRTLLTVADGDALAAVMAHFRWGLLLPALRDGTQAHREQCFVLAAVVLERCPDAIGADGAARVIEAVMVGLDAGKYREKESCLMPLCDAVQLADAAVFEIIIRNGFIEGLAPFLGVDGLALKALRALDAVAARAESAADVEQRMIACGILADIGELAASDNPQIAEAAQAFLAARRSPRPVWPPVDA
jgi:hypothetical protein